MREYQQKCMDEPEFALKSVPFTVIVKASTRSFRFEHNKPVQQFSLFKGDERKKDEFSTDMQSVVEWITGGATGMRSPETDVYGVVSLEMPDLSSQFVDIASLTESDTEADNKKSAKAYQDMQKEHIKRTRDSLVKAGEIADEKVRRALRITHRNLMKQWEMMAQDGKGRYHPSVCEYVGGVILAEELKKASSKHQEMISRFEKIAQSIVI